MKRNWKLENEFAEFKGSFPKRKGFQSVLRPGKKACYAFAICWTEKFKTQVIYG